MNHAVTAVSAIIHIWVLYTYAVQSPRVMAKLIRYVMILSDLKAWSARVQLEAAYDRDDLPSMTSHSIAQRVTQRCCDVTVDDNRTTWTKRSGHLGGRRSTCAVELVH